MDGYLAYFQPFAITSNAVVNIFVYGSWYREETSPKAELLGLWVCAYSVSLKAEEWIDNDAQLWKLIHKTYKHL